MYFQIIICNFEGEKNTEFYIVNEKFKKRKNSLFSLILKNIKKIDIWGINVYQATQAST